jgi:hypothetical protein
MQMKALINKRMWKYNESEGVGITALILAK